MGGPDRTGASLDLAQSYGALSWPDKPQVAMVVDSPRALPLRAVSLDEFDGVSFAPAGGGGGSSRALPINAGIITAGDGTDVGEQLTQRVTMAASSSQLVFASGRPQSIRGPFTGASAILGDAVRVDEQLAARRVLHRRDPDPRAHPGGARVGPPVPRDRHAGG